MVALYDRKRVVERGIMFNGVVIHKEGVALSRWLNGKLFFRGGDGFE
ncbi:hypothetical protein Tco_1049018, partial [Tanacetum coccineum]